MRVQSRAYLDLSLAMGIVGSSVVFGKIIAHSFPVFLASGLRFALALIVILPLARGAARDLKAFSRKDWGILTVMAFCGQFIFTVFLLWGLRLTGAIEAGIITSMTPAVMATISVVVLKESLTLRRAAGIILAVAGVLAVNGLFDQVDRTQGHWVGNLLILGAVVGEAFFLLLRKTMAPAVSSLTTTIALCLLGLILFLPLSLYQATGFDFSSTSMIDWGAILYFGLIFTAAAYMFWFRGVTKVSGTVAGLFTAVMPVSAVTLSCVFLDEPLTLGHAVGLAAVLSAILLITLEKSAATSKPRSLREAPVESRPGNL